MRAAIPVVLAAAVRAEAPAAPASSPAPSAPTASAPAEPAPAAAAPAPAGGAATDAEAPDTILVRLEVDDRDASRLVEPRAVFEGGVEVALVDDGSVEGDQGGDGIWTGTARLRRAQYAHVSVLDGGAEVGSAEVFLPSSAEAVVRLRVTGEGVESAREAVAGGAVEGPGAAGAGGGALVARLLWVAVAMFAVAFAWLRGAVWRAWNEEVRPVLRRLERFLDGAERGGR